MENKKKLVLHSVAHPYGWGEDEDKIIVATIVEAKQVKGNYSSDVFEGWRAVDKDGNAYYSQWESFDETSTAPRWRWYSDDLTLWYDITQGIMEEIPFRPKFMDDEEIASIIHYCDVHHILVQKDDSKYLNGQPCYLCYAEQRDPKKKQERLRREKENKKWKGWF
jgi:hypothetical protein